MLPRKRRPSRIRLYLLLLILMGGSLSFVFWHNSRESKAARSSATTLADAPQANADSISCADQLKTSVRVGLQIGHYQIDQLPDEQSSLRYDFGGSVDGVNEVDVNQSLAQKTADILRKDGITVEILPATVPPGYCANAFVAIHTDGNDDSTVYGYKIAPSFWDTDGTAQRLADDIQKDYGQDTGMGLNPTITDNMTQYYAFNYPHFSHALAPETPGVLIEVGFLTNSIDRYQMLNAQPTLAKGIADGILEFLHH